MPANSQKALVSASDAHLFTGIGGHRARVVFVLILALWIASNVPAAELPAGTNPSSQAHGDAERVDKLNDPLSSLLSVPWQSGFDFRVSSRGEDSQCT
jgi:hypothetical protein